MKIDKPFLVNFSWLNASSLINKLISFFYVIALVRILPKESFGIYTLVWAHLGLLGTWQDLGTTSYGLLQGNLKQHNILNNIFTLRLVLAFIVSVATIITALFFSYNPKIIFTIIVFSGLFLYSATTGFFLIISSLNKKLYYPAVFSIIFNTLLSVSNILMLFMTKNIYTVFKLTAAYYLIYGLLILFITNKYFFKIKLIFDLQLLKKVIKKSIIFSVISFFASLYLKTNFIIINQLLGAKDLATYSAAYKFLEVPLLMAANYNLSTIPVFKTLYNHKLKDFKRKIVADSIFVFFVSFIVVVLTWLFGQYIINFFFSHKYGASIQILNILIVVLPCIMFSSVFLNALYAQKKEKKVVFIFMLTTGFNIFLNLIFIPKYGYLSTAWIMVLTEMLATVFFGTYLLISLSYVKNKH